MKIRYEIHKQYFLPFVSILDGMCVKEILRVKQQKYNRTKKVKTHFILFISEQYQNNNFIIFKIIPLLKLQGFT